MPLANLGIVLLIGVIYGYYTVSGSGIAEHPYGGDGVLDDLDRVAMCQRLVRHPALQRMGVPREAAAHPPVPPRPPSARSAAAAALAGPSRPAPRP